MNTGAGRHERAPQRPRRRHARYYAMAIVVAMGAAAAGAGLLGGGRASADHCTVSATLVPLPVLRSQEYSTPSTARSGPRLRR